jgi:hypothetical protein
LSYFNATDKKTAMSSSHALLKYLRLLHLYIGVFTAPALLFFAFTGALQTFSLHETTRGSSYKPPAWAMMLAQIHKKQTPIVPAKKAAPDKGADKVSAEKSAPEKPSHDKLQASPASSGQNSPSDAPKPSDATAPRSHDPLPLKIFFLFVAIGLFLSTVTGLYMSYKFIRNKRLITAALIAGVVLPILLIIF